MKAPQFRQCHLKILRSLYSDMTEPVDRSIHKGKSNQNDTQEETPVSDKTFDLIQQFINQRSDYRPRKTRQMHWFQLHNESQSRLDDLLSISSELQDRKLQKRRATPSRTPLLNMMKRPTTPLSLNPLSANKKDIRDREHEITSWTFINALIQKRAMLCTSFCEDFRAQSFLGELHAECDTRVKDLHRRLKQLKNGEIVSVGDDDDEQAVKRQKTEHKHYFFRDYHSLDAHSSNIARNDTANAADTDELINELQIKLCLWSNLLSSVKEIVEEKKEDTKLSKHNQH